MQTTTLILTLLAMGAAAFYLGRERSLAVAEGPRKMLNLPNGFVAGPLSLKFHQVKEKTVGLM